MEEVQVENEKKKLRRYYSWCADQQFNILRNTWNQIHLNF